VQVSDSFVSPISSLAQCLASKDLKYTNLYFANPVNARVQISDVSVICLFVDHRDYSITVEEADVLGNLMQYLKSVLCYNLNRSVHEDGTLPKQSPEAVFSKCQEKIQVKSAALRNRHLLDILQIVNLFSAYQYLLKAVKLVEKPTQKLFDEKEETFFTLYKTHKNLLIQIVDQKMVRFFEELSTKDKFKARRVVDDLDESSSKERSIDPVDIEILSTASPKPTTPTFPPAANQAASSNAEKDMLQEFKSRLQEVRDWQSSLKKRNLGSIKTIREDYKKIPIAKKKLDDVLQQVKDPEEQRTLTRLRDEMVEGTASLRSDLGEVWGQWKNHMQSVLANSGHESQQIKELTRQEASTVTRVNGLIAKYAYFRRDEGIAMVLDKLEIVSNCLQILQTIRADPDFRPNRLSSSCKTSLERITTLMDRLKNTTDEAEVKNLPIYKLTMQKCDPPKANLPNQPSTYMKDKDKKGKNGNSPRTKSTSSRSISTQLKKRVPETGADEQFASGVIGSSSTSNEGVQKIIPEKGSSSESAENQSQAFIFSFSKGGNAPSRSLEANLAASKSARKIPVISQTGSSLVSFLKIQEVVLNLKPAKTCELSVGDVERLLRHYKLLHLVSNEAKFTELKSLLINIVSISAGK
jgi:hypothetical protein